MLILAHTLQAFHILLMMAVAFFMFRWLWIGPLFGATVAVATHLNGNECPITTIANRCFEAAGERGFPSALDWLISWAGKEMAAVTILFFGMAFYAGWVTFWPRRKRISRSK